MKKQMGQVTLETLLFDDRWDAILAPTGHVIVEIDFPLEPQLVGLTPELHDDTIAAYEWASIQNRQRDEDIRRMESADEREEWLRDYNNTRGL